MELQRGQVAVVTGAASGIGLALAERFASAGLSVVLADVEKGRLAAVEASVRARGVEVLSVETDVSRAESVLAMAAAAVERFGGVDLDLGHKPALAHAPRRRTPTATAGLPRAAV